MDLQQILNREFCEFQEYNDTFDCTFQVIKSGG